MTEILYCIEIEKSATGNICRVALQKGVKFTPLSKSQAWAVFQAECEMNNYGFILGSTQEELDKVPKYSNIFWKETNDLSLVSDFGAWGSLDSFVLHEKGIVTVA
jgi:hypothetical protein